MDTDDNNDDDYIVDNVAVNRTNKHAAPVVYTYSGVDVLITKY